ncbi:hypothetical protein [Clostridium sp. DL1XJH146]
MIVKIYLKNRKEPLIYIGDRIDILDFEREKTIYKQIRFFKKGFSRSEYIPSKDIKKIVEKKN